MSKPAAEGGTGAWAPLRRPIFLALFIAQLVSNIGLWMQLVASQWFLVEQQSGSAVVAWIQTASLVPVLLFSLAAGAWADRLDRRKLILWMTFASTLLSGGLAVLSGTGALSAGWLLAMSFLLGCAGAIAGPASLAIIPELVPRSEIVAASSLGGVTINAARAVGPALAGLVLAATNTTFVFALDAISDIGVLIVLLIWRRPPQESSLYGERFREAMAAGIRYVRSAPMIRRILLRSVLFSIPASALWALLPVAASEDLGVGASGYGLLLGVLGVGSVLGVVIVPWLRRKAGDTFVLVASAIAYAAGAAAVAWWPIAVVIPLLTLAGVAWLAALTLLNAAMQLTLPPWVRARGIGVYILVFLGSQAIGSFIWGWISNGIGAGTTLVVSAGVMVLGVSVMFLPLLPLTGAIDRTIVPYTAPTPTLLFTPDPTDGPVIVAIDYLVEDADVDDFLAAATLLRDSRRRVGGYSWSLERSMEHERLYREEFKVRSWAEFESSRRDRWTGFDAEQLSHVLEHAHQVTEEHYLPAAASR